MGRDASHARRASEARALRITLTALRAFRKRKEATVLQSSQIQKERNGVPLTRLFGVPHTL